LNNIILTGEKGMSFVTDMQAVFSGLLNACLQYDWLISDLECIWLSKNVPPALADRLAKRSLLTTGEELLGIVQSHSIQFVWAVFSALPKGTTVDVDSDCLPFADGNRNLWLESPKPQFPSARFEIVCWDATHTLLIGVNDELARAFKAAFPDAENLDAHNHPPLENTP
jgi:hypothetical protein